jgi:hypothetical protein
MFAICAETVKAWIVQLQKDPGLPADGKIADATAKHASVPQKPGTRSQYPGVAPDLIKAANGWLAENRPEAKEKTGPYRESVYQELAACSCRKGLF